MKAAMIGTGFGLLLLISPSQARADVTLDHAARGAYVNPALAGVLGTAPDGFRSATPPDSGDNYLVRAINSGFLTPDPADDFPVESDRNYHTFDLSGVTGTISGATLRIWADVGAYDSSADAETVGLFAVDTAAAVLDNPLSDTVAAAGAYADLGDGAAYGSFVTTAADDASYIEVALNAAAIADLNAALGSAWSLGGVLQTIDGSYNVGNISERVLKNDSSTTSEPPAQLVLTGNVIPEPSSLMLLGLVGVGLLASLRRG